MDAERTKREKFGAFMHRLKGQIVSTEKVYEEGVIGDMGDAIEQGKRWLLKSAYSSLEGEGEFYIPLSLRKQFCDFLDIAEKADWNTVEGFNEVNNAYKGLLNSKEYKTVAGFFGIWNFLDSIPEPVYNGKRGELLH